MSLSSIARRAEIYLQSLLEVGLIPGSSVPVAKTATVTSVAGPVYTIARLLGSTSVLSLVSGSNANLSLNASIGVISATDAIGSGVAQVAIVREAAGNIAIEYPVTVTGKLIVTPAPTPTPAPSPAPVTILGQFGELLSAAFARFNRDKTPEALTTAPLKIFYQDPLPVYVGPVDPTMSNWMGDPLLLPLTPSDNDRVFDDELDYDLVGYDSSNPSRSFFATAPAPLGTFSKTTGGHNVRIRGFDTGGRPHTHSRGWDITVEGPRGDFTNTPDADFLLFNGSSVSRAVAPGFRVARASSIGQKGNNRDSYLRTNDPTSPKITAAHTSVVKNTSTGKFVITVGAAFATKQTLVSGTWTPTRDIAVGDFITIYGSSYNSQSRLLQDGNCTYEVTAVLSPTTFEVGIKTPNNVPAGAFTATGGTAVWFANLNGTHADWAQWAQATGSDQPIYQRFINIDLGSAKGSYDMVVAGNSAASDCTMQLTRLDFEWQSVAPDDTSSGTYRVGWSGGNGNYAKNIFECYATTRPIDNLRTTLGPQNAAGAVMALSVAREGNDEYYAGYPGVRSEIVGLFTKGRPPGGDFAPYALSGFNYVHPGYSDINEFVGVIDDITFTGMATIDENLAGGTKIGLFGVTGPTSAHVIDFSVVASNVGPRQLALEGKRLVSGRTQIDYETHAVIAGVPTVSLTVRAKLRGSNPAIFRDKTFTWPINNLGASGTVAVATYAGHTPFPAPTATVVAAGQVLGAASADRKILTLYLSSAASPSRNPGAASISGIASTKLIAKRQGLSTNLTGNITHAAIYATDVPTGTTGDVSVAMGGSHSAAVIDTVALTGVNITEPYSRFFGTNAVVSGAITMDVDFPEAGTAVAIAYFATTSNTNKAYSALIFQRARGSYQVRATPAAADAFGVLNWEIYDVGTSAWVALDNTRGLVSKNDGKIEDGGSGPTVAVGVVYAGRS